MNFLTFSDENHDQALFNNIYFPIILAELWITPGNLSFVFRIRLIKTVRKKIDAYSFLLHQGAYFEEKKQQQKKTAFNK